MGPVAFSASQTWPDWLSGQPHRRYNPLAREWVLVSPHRTERPWQGQVETVPEARLPAYDPDCYLCPGNRRARGQRNPDYNGTFVFDNDFPTMVPETPPAQFDRAGLLAAETEPGICRVLCFSPRHDLTLARMEPAAIRGVVDAWAEQFAELGRLPQIRHVQIFENRGEMMGCSNPHPHCQIWANATIPDRVAAETAAQQAHLARRGRTLLAEYLELERDSGQRIVFETEHFAVLVPFWAVWPFETMILPKRHVTGLDELDPAERDSLAEALRRITTRYDNLFQVSFPYSMGFHQRPTDGAPHPEWDLHVHFYPPLLRSATVRKFLVGYEMLALPQRDITPETAAERLRSLSERHYAG
jgi:UDPglucose--hexose-1-phosphate uridylyltransferase